VTAQSVWPAFFVFAVVLVAVVLAVWAFLQRLNRKRTEALRAEALGLGLNFEGEGWVNRNNQPLLTSGLFSRGADRQFTNVMTGSQNRLSINIFDYSFLEGGGKGPGRYYRQTVGVFSKSSVHLSYFELRPSTIVDRIGDALTHENITFQEDTEFSRRYVLRGALNDKVRSLFTPSLRAFLERLDRGEKWHIDGTGHTLVIYRFARRTPPADLRVFLDQTTSLASSFFDLMGSAAPEQ
jgi:hypothetical protein